MNYPVGTRVMVDNVDEPLLSGVGVVIHGAAQGHVRVRMLHEVAFVFGLRGVGHTRVMQHPTIEVPVESVQPLNDESPPPSP